MEKTNQFKVGHYHELRDFEVMQGFQGDDQDTSYSIQDYKEFVFVLGMHAEEQQKKKSCFTLLFFVIVQERNLHLVFYTVLVPPSYEQVRPSARI